MHRSIVVGSESFLMVGQELAEPFVLCRRRPSPEAQSERKFEAIVDTGGCRARRIRSAKPRNTASMAGLFASVSDCRGVLERSRRVHALSRSGPSKVESIGIDIRDRWPYKFPVDSGLRRCWLATCDWPSSYRSRWLQSAERRSGRRFDGRAVHWRPGPGRGQSHPPRVAAPAGARSWFAGSISASSSRCRDDCR